ncbi:MAG TPA: hypothetical protein VFA70_12745 [Dehalococcoidia bacterium]|nr:hypothetical protein [Dehalococcoidia bacterium]
MGPHPAWHWPLTQCPPLVVQSTQVPPLPQLLSLVPGTHVPLWQHFPAGQGCVLSQAVSAVAGWQAPCPSQQPLAQGLLAASQGQLTSSTPS